ncbi:GNAT family N-acetyltransferase [Mucilaginibacter sabulilitoris]|uniref:GNAT family N-acetyltransferase n=1 Tax=Mucilaginibacter sabulilitoris TaxID=1173583 RepID=A0ABZ0TV77_9SPHI|nr:GNAT family N-acetyltransferase [Mucilaginibacter sabulilitoris]WPU95973.1 GNAT family N-acetyltransferase [Mucilaginibacter sabulilitoris]
MTTITTRLTTFNDIPVLQQLIAASVRSLSIGYNTPNQIESAIKYIFGIDTQLIIDGTYYVAQLGETIVGCGGWSKRNTLYGGDQHKDVEDPLLDPEHDAARIRAFFVHPDYSRRGIGRLMMAVCENAAQSNGFKSFQLGATLPGVPLYEAMGYRPIENINQPMPNGEVLPIVKMHKAL